MKKFWKKFKHWLIKKLGGYVGETHVIEHYTVKPSVLEVQISGVHLERYRSDSDFKEYIDKMLINKFGDYLYESRDHLVDIAESLPNHDSFNNPTISLRAIIKAYPFNK